MFRYLGNQTDFYTKMSLVEIREKKTVNWLLRNLMKIKSVLFVLFVGWMISMWVMLMLSMFQWKLNTNKNDQHVSVSTHYTWINPSQYTNNRNLTMKHTIDSKLCMATIVQCTRNIAYIVVHLIMIGLINPWLSPLQHNTIEKCYENWKLFCIQFIPVEVLRVYHIVI